MSNHDLPGLVADLSADYGYERSVKFTANSLIRNRYLLSLHKNVFSRQSTDALFGILHYLHAPESCIAEIRSALPGADVIHLGFEKQANIATYKLYLEHASRFRAAMESDGQRGTQQLVHLAFKWRSGKAAKWVKTYYNCQHDLNDVGVIDGMQVVYADRASSIVAQTAVEILQKTLLQTDIDELMFMQVHEEGNPRRSFDLNLYSAEMKVSDIAELLHKIANYFSIATDNWVRFIKDSSTEDLGHISGGIGRDGKEFLTVYFGVKGMSAGSRIPAGDVG